MSTIRIIPPAPKPAVPVTPESTPTPAQNPVAAGLSGSKVVLSYENNGSYEGVLKAYNQEFDPAGVHEDFLVQQMADSRWRIDRLKRLEAAVFDQMLMGDSANQSPDHRIAAKLAESGGDLLTKLSRHQAALERSYYRAYKELMNGRKPKTTADQTIEQLLDIMTAPPRPASFKTNSAAQTSARDEYTAKSPQGQAPKPESVMAAGSGRQR